MSNTRIKICCIGSLEEVQLAISHGVSALGLVSAMPSGPGVIEESLIADIAQHTPPGVANVLLTSKQDATSIIDQQRRCRVNTLQLCDALPFSEYPKLHGQLPGITIMQVIHVRDESAIDEAADVAPHVHGLLLDSGN
ncbi:MAG: phosphoribosylanthranilate isomerase, partial [Pseudomonadota bacterium]